MCLSDLWLMAVAVVSASASDSAWASVMESAAASVLVLARGSEQESVLASVQALL